MNDTRLARLCRLHDQQGGTIFQFNELYKTDFLRMHEADFTHWYHCMIQDKAIFGKLQTYGWIQTGIYKGSETVSHWEIIQYREPD